MIIGLGSDICEIKRIEKTLERFGERFIKRCFTKIEIEKAEKRLNRAATYAKRFAAKEALAKALGTGISNGVYWRDMGVVNLASGKPTFTLTNGAAKILHNLVPKNFVPHIHLTISDDNGMAQAFVIIEALPNNKADFEENYE